jgi:hypothetical protein
MSPTDDYLLASHAGHRPEWRFELLVRAVVNPVRLPSLVISEKPDVPALLTLQDEGDLLGAHGKCSGPPGGRPTKAATAVPTASIGFEPDETSSMYTPTALRTLFLAFLAATATTATPIPASAQAGPVIAPSPA